MKIELMPADIVKAYSMFSPSYIGKRITPEFCKVIGYVPMTKSPKYKLALLRDRDNPNKITRNMIVIKSIEGKDNLYDIDIPFAVHNVHGMKYENFICSIDGNFFTMNRNSKEITSGDIYYKHIVFTSKSKGLAITRDNILVRLDFSNRSRVVPVATFPYDSYYVMKGLESYEMLLDEGEELYTKGFTRFRYSNDEVIEDDNHLLIQLIEGKIARDRKRKMGR